MATSFPKFQIVFPELSAPESALKRYWEQSQSRKLECEEWRDFLNELTMDQLQVRLVPSIITNKILELTSARREEIYKHVEGEELQRAWMETVWDPEFREIERVQSCAQLAKEKIVRWEQRNKNMVGRMIEKIRFQLALGFMKAEGDASKLCEVMERMYVAESKWCWYELSYLTVPFQESPVKLFCDAFLLAEAELLKETRAAMVLAATLLLIVFRYLTGHIDKGGTLTCSSGSLQFRDTYISVVLTDGAYVWIWFREVVYTSIPVGQEEGEGSWRSWKTGPVGQKVTRYQLYAKYTPPGQSGNSLHLGVCENQHEAKIKRKIARYLYGKDNGELPLPVARQSFVVPPERREQLSLQVESEVQQLLQVESEVQQLLQVQLGSESPVDDLRVYFMREGVVRAVQETYEEYKRFESRIRAQQSEQTDGSEEGPRIATEPSSIAFDPDFRLEEIPYISPEDFLFPDLRRDASPLRQAVENVVHAQGPAADRALTADDHNHAVLSTGLGQHDQGFASVFAAGYNSGFAAGYNSGFAAGYESGFASGSALAFPQGLPQGSPRELPQGSP